MKKSVLGLMILLTLFLSAGIAMAHRSGGGMMGGSGSDDGYGFCQRYADADPAEVKAITDKHASQFEALRKKMEAKREAMHKARDNDDTTMGQMKVMRAEMHAVKKEYRALADSVDDELAEKFGEIEDDGPRGMMGGQHHRGGMMDGPCGCR